MPSAIEQFKIGLYREHLEEVSALYDLRSVLLREPSREWRSLADFEARIEAHIDALVVGDALAMDVCAEKMREGDAGELFAALCVCCRRRASGVFAAMWQQLDFDNLERVRAVTEALKFELPDTWNGSFEQALALGDAHRFPVLAVAAAARRLPVGSQIAARLMSAEEVVDARSVSALGRWAGPDVTAALHKCLRSSDASVRSEALRGLVLAGDERALQSSYLAAQADDWPHLAMGLGGDRQEASLLRQQAEAGRATRSTLIGLGLLGDLSTVRALLAALAVEELADPAALALHWITGAPLFEDVFVPDPIDESELFEREKSAWLERGEVPRRVDGRPYGSEVRRLTREHGTWNQWLTDHAREFEANVRYRRGQPYSARAVFECLTTEVAPAALRRLAFEELVVRYGCPDAFEPDARVVDQLASLRQIALWIEDNDARFIASRGRFFRAGAV